jgi:hypothetical protein
VGEGGGIWRGGWEKEIEIKRGRGENLCEDIFFKQNKEG